MQGALSAHNDDHHQVNGHVLSRPLKSVQSRVESLKRAASGQRYLTSRLPPCCLTFSAQKYIVCVHWKFIYTTCLRIVEAEVNGGIYISTVWIGNISICMYDVYIYPSRTSIPCPFCPSSAVSMFCECGCFAYCITQHYIILGMESGLLLNIN